MSTQELAEAEAVLKELRSLRNTVFSLYREADPYYGIVAAERIRDAVNDRFHSARTVVNELKGGVS